MDGEAYRDEVLAETDARCGRSVTSVHISTARGVELTSTMVTALELTSMVTAVSVRLSFIHFIILLRHPLQLSSQ